jgi:hypothetical protein
LLTAFLSISAHLYGTLRAFTRIRFQRIIASSYIGKDKEDEAAAKANAPVARDKNGYKVQYPHDYDTYY